MKGSSSFTYFLDLESFGGGVSLACLIFARSTRSVTRYRKIDFL